MRGLPAFLKDKRKRELLGWLGGGLAAVAVGAWAVFVYVFPPDKGGDSKPTVNAETQGGVAAGIEHSTIAVGGNVYGISEEHFQALSGELGVTKAALKSFFKILEQKQVPAEDLDSTLREIAARYKRLQAKLASFSSDDPAVTDLKRAAKEALEVLDFAQADRLLAEAEAMDEQAIAQQQETLDSRKLSKAATRALRGELALTGLRYREAAIHFANAAEQVPQGHDAEHLDYLDHEADALYRQGDEFGDNTAVTEAIARYRALLGQRSREEAPLQWAATQNNLGSALERLGERESGTARLEEAVAAFRAALQEYTPEEVPLDWAMTQNNLGSALERLGERESGTARLEEAVAAYRAALEERTRERVPLAWAATQNNLGNALSALGEREDSTARLEEAVAAYRAALEEHTRERVPLAWAATQNNLGNALSALGEREDSTARLEEAVASFLSVLQVDPNDERAHAALNSLYHEKLFAFAEAFDMSQVWLKRHPDNFSAQANFAEALFTVGRFAEAEQRLAALVDRPELNPGIVVALRALEICSLVALDRRDTLKAKLDAFGDLLRSTRDELAANWTFAGSRHFIGEHPELSQHPWLIRLLAAVEERNAADARAAVEVGQAASAATGSH